MVLKAEFGVVGHFKVGAIAVKTPDYGTVCAIDLVHGTGVACRDEIVAVSVLVDTVDVEVIPRIGRVVSGACLTRVDWEDRFCIGHEYAGPCM